MPVIFRPTKSLARRMGFDLEATDTISSTRLGDWTAIDIVLSRKQYVLCACDNSSLAIILKGAPYHTLAERLPAELGALLASMNLSKELIAEEIGRMDTIHYAKTVNRSILVVHPEFQKKGCGKLMMESLVSKVPSACIHLTSTFGNEDFYKRLGFRKHKTAMAKYPSRFSSSTYLET